MSEFRELSGALLGMETKNVDRNFLHQITNLNSSSTSSSIPRNLIEDLLVQSTTNSAQQPSHGSLSKHEISKLATELQQYYCVPLKSGWTMLNESISNASLFSTGCKSLDAILGKGIRSGEVIELIGPTSTAKTQICFSATVEMLLNGMHNVVYIDSSNAFSPKRISEMLAYRFASETMIDDGQMNENEIDHQLIAKKTEKSLQNIRLHSSFDVFDVLKILEIFQFRCQKEQSPNFEKNTRLLILDSVTPLIGNLSLGANSGFNNNNNNFNNNSGSKKYGNNFNSNQQTTTQQQSQQQDARNDTGFYRNYLIDLLGSQLKRIAVECNLVVLVVNSVLTKENKPALGQLWGKLASTRLLLSQQSVSNERCFQATLYRSSWMPNGSSVMLQVNNGGLVAVSLPEDQMNQNNTQSATTTTQAQLQ